jgi:hypothetical protein
VTPPGGSEFEYSAINWPGWECPTFVVSTFAAESLLGTRSGSGANFTIRNSQKQCFFQLSSTVIALSSNHEAEPVCDQLDYPGSSVAGVEPSGSDSGAG